ncbi:LysR family transcriptional regulator [Dongia soli]|uniref:LysR family transcriptional regulator n=1 Tax=Dongia soli TaxID=600628 RepID=A0ABU5E6F6_9PROT|nr:LysR family transcriptional regulator [Dongia soli]MDY0881614.1 LysR family transcriptional regulator [Dongia soli]
MPQSDSVLATAYRYFLFVAEAGSVRAAARNLNVAASAVSRQLLLLEAQLGIELFERHGRSLTLSAAGTVLLKTLKVLQTGHEEALAVLSGFQELKRGRIRLATVESIAVTILPDLVTAFNRTYPGIQISITVAGSDAVIELVRDHDADLGFAFNPTRLEGLAVDFEQGFPLGATMAPSHPLADKAKLTLSDCLRFPVAWPAHGLSLRAILDEALTGAKAAHRPPEAAFECNSLRLMASLARSGGCIAFQTRIGIEQDIHAGSLLFRPLADRGLPPDRLMLVPRPRLAKGTAASVFAGLARQYLQKMNRRGSLS